MKSVVVSKYVINSCSCTLQINIVIFVKVRALSNENQVVFSSFCKTVSVTSLTYYTNMFTVIQFSRPSSTVF